jgi:hypothetical protein
VRLEGLGQLKNRMTSEIEPATFRLVASIKNEYQGKAAGDYSPPTSAEVKETLIYASIPLHLQGTVLQ